MTFLEGRFRIGVNFWAREHGPRMWSRPQADDYSAELAQARAIGFDLLRIFAFIPDFVRGEPGNYRVLDEALARMKKFAANAPLDLLVSPLVGHMSGENFDLPGAGDRSLFEDADLRQGARLLVEKVATTLRDCKSVAGYALTNEAPLWGGLHEGKRPPPAAIVEWARTMIEAARVANVPLGLGDGLMPEFPNDALRPLVDFVGPHMYGGDVDALRQGYRYDHAIALSLRAGKPALLEEFGGSSTQAGEHEHAALWNEGLFAAFTLGARGALGWCWSDFPVETVGREAPYEHHGFELGFGITRADGSEKPAAATIRAWRKLIDSLPASPPLPASDVVLVRSSYLETPYPFSWIDRAACERAEQTTFALLSQAGMTPQLCDEVSLAPAQLYIVPVTQRLLTSTWLTLLDKARAGATVYWSWFGGDHSFHQGDWCPLFEQLTGCRHRLRYGCFDFLEQELTLGDLCNLPTGDHTPPNAFIPIELRTSRALFNAGDRPIVIEHKIGRGRVIFSAAPLERYAAQLDDSTTRGLHRLYRTMAPSSLPLDLDEHEARLCVRKVAVGDRRLIVVMNRSWTPVALPQSWPQPLWSHAPMPGPANALGAKAVAVFLDGKHRAQIG